MSVPLAVGGVVGIGAIATASYFGVMYFAKGENTPKLETELVTLSSIDDYITKNGKNGEHKDKFGGKFAIYFLSVQHNDEEWQTRAKDLTTDVTGSFFSTVKSSNDKTAEIKKKCKEKYEADLPPSANTEANKWDEVWKFCSLLGNKPVTVETFTNSNGESNEKKENLDKAWSNNKLGSKLKAKLLSLEGNQKYWEITDKAFEEKEISIQNSDNFFKEQTKTNKSLKFACEAAYKLESSDSSTNSAPKEDEVLRYCSIQDTKA